MLRKLLKYELKATGRTLLPLYIALVIFAIINRFILGSSPTIETPAAISMIVYISVLIGTLVMTLIVMIQRFNKNLLSDEGYLMFTLPTTPWKHIVSKLLVSLMWTIAGGVIAFSSILILAADEIDLAVLFEMIGDVLRLFTESPAGLSSFFIVLELLLLGFISLASGVLIIYASIAIGHLTSKHRVLVSLGAYIGLFTLSQILAALLGSIPVLSYMTDNVPDFPSALPQLHLVLWTLILFIAFLSALYFAITNTILNKRLNLE